MYENSENNNLLDFTRVEIEDSQPETENGNTIIDQGHLFAQKRKKKQEMELS
jgi:hypothetical protein